MAPPRGFSALGPILESEPVSVVRLGPLRVIDQLATVRINGMSGKCSNAVPVPCPARCAGLS